VLAGTLKQHKPSALATATTRASGERPRLSRDENVFEGTFCRNLPWWLDSG